MIKTKLEILEYLQDKENSDFFDISAKKDKTIRSYAQVKYYWSVIVDIIWNYHWMTPIDTNESLKLLFKQETFTELDTSEFKFVCESIIEMWQVKYSVKIPLPRDLKDEQSLYASLWF